LLLSYVSPMPLEANIYLSTASRASTLEIREEFCKPAQQDGILLLNKRRGSSSAACLTTVKKRLGQRRIGHAGTLDPMAEGLLVVLLGQATKISGPLMHAGEKIYSGVIRLGIETDTWDAEGRILERLPVRGVDHERVRESCASFVGTYEQEVPAYSAAKHRGRPLYELARRGLETPVKRKMVSVYRCEAELVDPERIFFRVCCASGTYIRSLAHSLGKRLGCGAMLEKLTREYSRPFGIENARTLEEIVQNPEELPDMVVSIAGALPDWPHIRLGREDVALIRMGKRLSVTADRVGPAPGRNLLLLEADGKALALAECLAGEREDTFVLRATRGLWNT
jgi:tRNA pseudouridine55 synthase